jgi:hypothetical protein
MAHKIRREPDAADEPLVIGDTEGGVYAALRYVPDAAARGERGALVIEHAGGELRFTRNAVRLIVPWLESRFWVRRKTLLCSAGDIPALGDCSARTAHNWTRRDDFPRPLGETAAGPIWDRRLVEAWIRDHRPRPGRRPRGTNGASD